MQADRQSNKQTYIHTDTRITIRRTPTGRSNYLFGSEFNVQVTRNL